MALRRQPWTEPDIITLKNLYAKGRTYQQIAEAMGRTTASVTSKIGELFQLGELEHRRKKLARGPEEPVRSDPRWQDYPPHRLRAMRQATGLTDHEWAKRVGCKVSSVRGLEAGNLRINPWTLRRWVNEYEMFIQHHQPEPAEAVEEPVVDLMEVAILLTNVESRSRDLGSEVAQIKAHLTKIADRLGVKL